ncbi:hypothetical protein LSH36_804g00030 [Paralvinella palmiformis]|uniref:Uncharacterized protein n=1 Tax=Paralvinella palmiformis TaxID=53620 RepID=A0AAD9MTU4_9ANNE|nr:hypothetical protein LSH36_804g00030 [Paralvinella palmiformis]
MAIGIKYSFANSWISKSAYILQDRNKFCDEESINKITKCGLRQLFEGLDSRKSLRKSKQSINYSDFFNRNLEAICRQYDTYRQCLRESEVDECAFRDNSIIDILYSHICFEGKQALETSSTGMCLSNLKPSAVIKIAKMTPGCEYCLVDLSSSLSAMLSVFHDHDKDEQNEAVMIKQNLLLICRNWHLLEKCIIPAYGKVCGETAQSFYVSLLNKVKNNLASVYKAYGADIEMIARCNKTTGEAVMSVLRNGSNDEEILNYAQRQRDIFSVSEKEFELRCGQCSPEKTSFTLTACFWSTVYNVGSKWMAMIPQLTHNQKKMCRLLKLFQGCYHDAVSSCPRSSKIDFSDLFQIICDVAQESSMMCFNAISDLSIHQSECGTTLSEITEYYLYKAAVIYEVDQTVCSGSSNIP